MSLPVVGDRRAIRKSRSSPRRAIVLAVVQLLIIAHIVQWLVTGHTISPIEPSESMEAVKHGVINAGAVFFALALLSTLVLGRWFCGWGCHLVMLQDGCAWIMRRIGIRPKAFRSRLLVYVPFVLALYMFVWPAVYRWGVVPLSARLHDRLEAVPAAAALEPWTGLDLELTTSDFWATFPGWVVAVPFLLICGFACVYFLGAKGFCTYGCPYGGFFAPVEQYAPGRIRVTDACEHCGHCTAVCSSNVRVHEEVREYGMVVDPGCMKCLDCVSVCPNDALYYGFGRPGATKGKARHRTPRRVFDLTLGEEVAAVVVFPLAVVAVRGVYDVVPLLMAVGIAGCVTFLVWKHWRMMRDPSVSLHRARLKFRGSVTNIGRVFVGLVVAGVVLVAHCGAVNLLEHLADRADRRVTLPHAAALGVSPVEMPPEMARHAERAMRFYRLVAPIGDGGIGLLRSPGVETQLASLHIRRLEFAEAERLLRRHAARYGLSDTTALNVVLLMEARLESAEALAYARAVVAEHPHHVQTLDWLIRAVALAGDREEAIRLCREGIERNARRPAAHLQLLRRLSLLLLEAGELDEAVAVFRRTIEIDDTNPAAFALLARALVEQGDRAGAIEALRRAVELAPGQPELRDELNALLEAGPGDGG